MPAAAARAIETPYRQAARPFAGGEAALGIVQIIDAKMADGVRAVSVARGFDPRDACLVAAGGAGPLHACGIADELGMELILVPRASSVFCATGMLATDLRQDVVRHASIRLGDAATAVAALNALRADLLARAAGASSTASRSQRKTARWNSPPRCCSRGSSTPSKRGCRCSTPRPSREARLAAVRAAFEAAHRQTYGYVLEGEPVEIRSLRLAAIGRTVPPQFPAARHGDISRPRRALKGARRGLVRRRSSGGRRL